MSPLEHTLLEDSFGEVFSRNLLTHFRDDEVRRVSSRAECTWAPLLRLALARGASASNSKTSRLRRACPLRSWGLENPGCILAPQAPAVCVV